MLNLSGAGLLSKWGFMDGDVIRDWVNSRDIDTDIHHHRILIHLVKKYLIPQLPYEIELALIHGIHNPIRARLINGVTVEWYNSDFSSPVANHDMEISDNLVMDEIRALEADPTLSPWSW